MNICMYVIMCGDAVAKWLLWGTLDMYVTGSDLSAYSLLTM